MKSLLSFLKSPGPQDRNTSLGLLIIRLGAGLTMLVAHGWGKLSNFAQASGGFPDPLGVGSKLSLSLAVGAEVAAALLLAIGFFSRAAALPLLVTMLVAFFLVHGSDPFKAKELAFVYAFIFLGLFFTGPGKYSVDAKLRR